MMEHEAKQKLSLVTGFVDLTDNGLVQGKKR